MVTFLGLVGRVQCGARREDSCFAWAGRTSGTKLLFLQKQKNGGAAKPACGGTNAAHPKRQHTLHVSISRSCLSARDRAEIDRALCPLLALSGRSADHVARSGSGRKHDRSSSTLITHGFLLCVRNCSPCVRVSVAVLIFAPARLAAACLL
jgi:hypothetical protein